MQRDLLTTDQGDVFQKEPIIRLRSRSGVSRTAPQLRENWWPALKIAARCCSLTTCRPQRGLPDKIRTPPEVTGLHLLMCIVSHRATSQGFSRNMPARIATISDRMPGGAAYQEQAVRTRAGPGIRSMTSVLITICRFFFCH